MLPALGALRRPLLLDPNSDMRATLPAIALTASLCFGVPLAAGQTNSKAKSAAAKSTTAKPAGSSGSKSPAAPPTDKGATGAIGPVAPLPRVYAPVRPRDVAPKFPWRKNIATTIFWIGETPTENNPTPNHASSWDTQWQLRYGGYDDPNRENRSWDFRPKAFTPGLNPFYVALPFNDVTNPEAAKKIPWYKERKAAGARSVCQSVWLAVRFGNKTCYAQWEDCGPFTTTDHEYVFGGKPPKNRENNGAGLDVSPAVRDFLGISSGALCDWRFCTYTEVPDGPWKRYGMNNTFLKKEQSDIAAMRKQYEDLVRRRDEWLKMQGASRVQ
jgi:hypothetical protein